jgi:hypothetical protein
MDAVMMIGTGGRRLLTLEDSSSPQPAAASAAPASSVPSVAVRRLPACISSIPLKRPRDPSRRAQP